MQLTVNGQPTTVESHADWSLLNVLREDLELTAAKPACGEGVCGACSVLVDGSVVRSCITSASSVAQHEVQTLEGLRDKNVWAAVVDSFARVRAFQCGYCTPGMVVAAGALLRANPSPTSAEIIEALDGNVCRCGTYRRILAAVHDAAGSLQMGRPADPLGPDSPPPAFDPAVFARGAATPWDLASVDERDWFDRLGDGLVVVLPPEETRGAWSTDGGAWLHVAPDGLVTAFTGKVDVGQDNTTALAAIVAEYLGVDPARVRLVMGDTDFAPHDMGTFGSRSTPDAGSVLATVAASARSWLDENGGPPARGTREVIEARAGARQQTERGAADGIAAVRRAALDIASGRTRFTTDHAVPGMGHGRAIHPPVHGAHLEDASLVEPDRSEVTFVRDAEFAGVVAPDPYAADKTVAAIEARWDVPDKPSEPDLADYLRAHPVEEHGWEGAFEDAHGDLERALSRAAATYEATFTTAYLAHTPLETRCAVAVWEADRVTIWTGTQRPFGVRGQVANELGIDESRIRVIVPATGSGYGGKHSGEAAVEAARLARAAGRPVKVRWSRADEFSYAYFRPAALMDVRAGLDDRGRITAWQHTNLNAGPMALECPYDIANTSIRYQPTDSPLRIGSYRALAATANNFARESAIDELAHLVGEDALDFRLRHLRDDRLREVLTQAANAGGWGSGGQSAGSALGIACGHEKDGRIATLVEISADLRLSKIVAAYDCGRVVDPDNLRNQIEGALVMGMGGALFEAIHFEHGRVTNGSMRAYRVPRFSDVPPIEVILVNRPDEPSVGAGETPIIAIAPAIANAIYVLTGERRRSMPLLG